MRQYVLTRGPWLVVGLVIGAAAAWLLRPQQVTPAAAPAPAAEELKVPARWRDDGPPADLERAPYPSTVRLSADGRRLLVAWGRGVRVWDLPSGRSVTLDPGPERGVNNPTLSPDGRWVLGFRGSQSDWQLVTWDADTGAEARVEPVTKYDPASGGWRPEVLGIDRDGAAWVLRRAVVERVGVPSGKVMRTIAVPYPASAYCRLTVSPDGRWLALGTRTVFAVRDTQPDEEWVTVGFWDEPKEDDCLPQPTHCPIPCGFSPDSRRLVTYDYAGKVLAVWRLGGDMPRKVASRAPDLDGDRWLHELTFTASGERVACVVVPAQGKRTDRAVHVWDIDTLAEKSRVTSPAGVEGLTFTPDGRLILAHPDGTLSARAASGK